MTKKEKIEKLKEIYRLLKILKKSIKIKDPNLREVITEKEIKIIIDLIKSFNVIASHQI